jgi:hypothetical protein
MQRATPTQQPNAPYLKVPEQQLARVRTDEIYHF